MFFFLWEKTIDSHPALIFQLKNLLWWANFTVSALGLFVLACIYNITHISHWLRLATRRPQEFVSERASDEVARSRPSSRAILLKSDDRFFWKSIIGWMRYFSRVASQCTFRTCFLFWSHDRTNSCPVTMKRKIPSVSNCVVVACFCYESEKKDKSLALCNTKQCLPKKEYKYICHFQVFNVFIMFKMIIFTQEGKSLCIVGCYMLRPSAHPVACCRELLRKVWN